MNRIPKSVFAAVAMAAAPLPLSAHDGSEHDAASQLLHVATAPHHVATTLLLAVGVVALLAFAFRRRDRS